MIFGDYGWLKVMWGALLRTVMWYWILCGTLVHPTSVESPFKIFSKSSTVVESYYFIINVYFCYILMIQLHNRRHNHINTARTIPYSHTNIVRIRNMCLFYITERLYDASSSSCVWRRSRGRPSPLQSWWPPTGRQRSRWTHGLGSVITAIARPQSLSPIRQSHIVETVTTMNNCWHKI
jgi:hypothetical protein